MEARDDEEIADGQNIQSTNESGCPSVSSDERTTGKLGYSLTQDQRCFTIGLD